MSANDQFIRTTDPDHKQQVQEFWTTVRDNGDVYEGRYEGPYCVDCEEFKLPSDVEVDDEGIQVCPIHHTPLETVSETNYFFAHVEVRPARCSTCTSSTRSSSSRSRPETR